MSVLTLQFKEELEALSVQVYDFCAEVLIEALTKNDPTKNKVCTHLLTLLDKCKTQAQFNKSEAFLQTKNTISRLIQDFKNGSIIFTRTALSTYW